MTSINQVWPTVMDFRPLDKFHRDSGQQMLPSGLYPLKDAAPSECLYVTLVEEEMKELNEALQKLTTGSEDDGTMTIDDLAEIAKEGLDLIVVVVGLLKSLGVPIKDCWDELNRELESKRLPDGSFLRREDGKILKPDTFKKADFVKVLEDAAKYRQQILDDLLIP